MTMSVPYGLPSTCSSIQLSSMSSSSGVYASRPSTPQPPARLTAATTSRQCENAKIGNSIPRSSEIAVFMPSDRTDVCLTRSTIRQRPALGLLNGKDDLEPRVTRRRLHADLAAVAADDDLPGDVEAEAGPPAHFFGGEERLEDAVANVVGHPGTGVADLDHDAIVADGAGSHRE